MDLLKNQVDLFLTEISIELLGNKIYDSNGKRTDKLVNLFKAPKETKKSDRGVEQCNDFLSSLGYKENFTDKNETTREFLNDQFDYILKDANTSPKVNDSIITFLRDYKKDQTRLVEDAADLNTKKVLEHGRLIQELNKSRAIIFTENRSNAAKKKAADEYYEAEKNQILKLSMDALRLLKYSISDPRNSDELKGELIGFVHAMRQVKSTIRTKPYSLGRVKRAQ